MRILSTILDILFPPKCVSCQKEGWELCPVCIRESPPAMRESAEWIFPLYDYRHPPIKKALWSLKYYGRKQLASVLAEAAYVRIAEELYDLSTLRNFASPVLVPIPLSQKRLRERGFNQAGIICREIVRINFQQPAEKRIPGLSFNERLLIKIKDTGHQARISNRKNRMQNILGSFEVHNKLEAKGKNIILIDDILTTGATLSEAKRVFKKAGSRKIIAFTIAH